MKVSINGNMVNSKDFNSHGLDNSIKYELIVENVEQKLI